MAGVLSDMLGFADGIERRERERLFDRGPRILPSGLGIHGEACCYKQPGDPCSCGLAEMKRLEALQRAQG